ncbi:MAG: universal stress protein [Gemmatimonadaceae bacterium]
MRVLVAIDGWNEGHAAVDALVRQPLPQGSVVRVISVVEPMGSFAGAGTDMGAYFPVEQGNGDSARAAVNEAAATLRTHGSSVDITVTTEVLSGSPTPVILAEAESFAADWIFVGAHGHGKLERFLLGSVSQAVAGRATCSVAIVRIPHAQR